VVAAGGRKCDWYDIKLAGESPVQTQIRGTVSEGKGVHCEVESEESRIQNAGLTNRKHILGRDTWTRMLPTPKSNTYPEGINVDMVGEAGKFNVLPSESCNSRTMSIRQKRRKTF
jgi:hypothetical protein